MVGLYPVVSMPFDVIPRRGNQLIEHRRVHRHRVSDHLGGSHLHHGHRPADEPACRSSVAAGGDEYLDDLAVLVDGPVHVPPDTANLRIRLVDIPPVTGCVPAEPGRIGQQRTGP